MDHRHGLTPILAIGLMLAIILDTAGQLLWKFAVGTLPNAGFWPSAKAVLAQPLFVGVAAIFLLQLFNWLKVLDQADLSFAQPITSLSYVTVAGLSKLLFDEPVGAIKVAGILCILAGVWVISRGRRQTNAPETRL